MKTQAAPGWLVTLSVTLETTGMMLALYWGQLMVRGGRRRALFWGGLAGRLVMLAAFAVTTAGQFTLLVCLVHMFATLVYPTQNGILQANIRPGSLSCPACPWVRSGRAAWPEPW